MKFIKVMFICCFIFNIGVVVYSFVYRPSNSNISPEKGMRFPIQIKSGEYKGYSHMGYDLNPIEDIYKTIKINDIDAKYSRYVVTGDTSYIECDINSKYSVEYIKYDVPISVNRMHNLRSFMKKINSNALRVEPFNDGIYCLVTANKTKYILNIDTLKVLWKTSISKTNVNMNYNKDTIIVGYQQNAWDTKTYEFNKYGKRISPTMDLSIATVITIDAIVIFIICYIAIVRIVENRDVYNILCVCMIILGLFIFLYGMPSFMESYHMYK